MDSYSLVHFRDTSKKTWAACGAGAQWSSAVLTTTINRDLVTCRRIECRGSKDDQALRMNVGVPTKRG